MIPKLTLENAIAQNRCRLCGLQAMGSSGNPIVFNFGSEYAHQQCIRQYHEEEGLPFKATLEPAYFWQCTSCGHANYCRAVLAELNQEELEELRELGYEHPWDNSKFFALPEEVCCGHCCRTHQTESFRESGN